MSTPPDLPISTETAARLPTRLPYLGPLPLIRGEEEANYDTLLARVSGAVKPADALEEIWVRDVVDLVWEAVRLRRLKAALVAGSVKNGLASILRSFDVEGVHGIVGKWVEADTETVRDVDQFLASSGLSMDTVMAQTMYLRLNEVERFDRMIMSAEVRRNAALRELEQRRASLAQRLRRATEEAATVEDAEFEVVAPAAVEGAA